MSNDEYLRNQIITYMGNKRKLLSQIEVVIDEIQGELGKNALTIGDGFSGSGIVSRLLKTKAEHLYVNDIAGYSKTLNECYLSNPSNQCLQKINAYINQANKLLLQEKKINQPWISKHWAPSKENIQKGERAYFTHENGKNIDILRDYIDTLPKKYQPFLLAPLLVQSSIHNNTNGQFSAFYKNGEIGAYGGKNKVDTKRITAPIKLMEPIFHKNNTKIHISQMDTNDWIKTISSKQKLDVVYYDPPYNKHPYSIYYFLLDIINDWDKTIDIPDSNRGQPLNWFTSNYNSKKHARTALEDLIKHTNASYIVLSYNDGGIIPIPELDELLKNFASNVEKIPITHKTYNRLKGISNYKREKEYKPVKEFLYVIKKKHE